LTKIPSKFIRRPLDFLLSQSLFVLDGLKLPDRVPGDQRVLLGRHKHDDGQILFARQRAPIRPPELPNPVLRIAHLAFCLAHRQLGQQTRVVML
jgi:hypothetical protein